MSHLLIHKSSAVRVCQNGTILPARCSKLLACPDETHKLLSPFFQSLLLVAFAFREWGVKNEANIRRVLFFLWRQAVNICFTFLNFRRLVAWGQAGIASISSQYSQNSLILIKKTFSSFRAAIYIHATATILHETPSQTNGIKSTCGCRPSEHILFAPLIAPSVVIPTLCFQTFTQLGLCLSVGPQATFGVELVGHGGCSDHSLQAALALGHVLLRMKEHHVDFGHVEHSQRDWRTEAHRDGQGCGLDVHLFSERDKETHCVYLQKDSEAEFTHK